jgi:uncharacterized protein (TIGR02757 family)
LRSLTFQTSNELKEYLDEIRIQYSTTEFIRYDPISVPHEFQKKQDIEIAGFIAATFAWGQRKTIIKKSREFLSIMGADPHEFVLNHSADDLKAFQSFKHRTFNGQDALAFIRFFQGIYQNFDSMEDMLFPRGNKGVKNALEILNEKFRAYSNPLARTLKHVQDPNKGSACKRMNMFFRWMVRWDSDKIDFGLWKSVDPALLICPMDVHVAKAAWALGMISSPKSNWSTAEELTGLLRKMDPGDPVKYDIALFSLGQSLQ